MLSRFVERVELEQLDRALGLFLGIIEGAVVVLVIILLIKLQPLFPAEKLQKTASLLILRKKYLNTCLIFKKDF